MTNLVERLSENMNSLGVKRSYGDPVTIGGVETVPVALVWFGFGGGGGEDGEGKGSGEGGGGGGASIPIGAYVGGPDGARFEPNAIALLVVLIPLTWVSGKAMARVIRALKR